MNYMNEFMIHKLYNNNAKFIKQIINKKILIIIINHIKKYNKNN